MACVVSGLLKKQIAGKLSTAEKTVKFHRGHIMRKMRARSLAALVRMAEHLGIERSPGTGGGTSNSLPFRSFHHQFLESALFRDARPFEPAQPKILLASFS